MGGLDQKLLEVRSNICDACLLAFAIIVVPTLASSLYRAVEFGWQPVMAVHILFATTGWGILLLRKRIPYHVRALFLVALFAIVGLAGIWTFGLVSAASAWVVVAPILTTVLFGTRSGLVTLIVMTMASSMIGTVTVIEQRRPNFDLPTYATSASTWVTAIFGWVIASGSIMFVVGAFNKFLVESATTSRRNAKAMKESERKYRNILDNMQDVFFRTDTEGRLVMISPSVEVTLGFSPVELIERDMIGLFGNSANREKFLEELARQDGNLTGYETPMRHKDGHIVQTSTNAQYHLNERGQILGVEGVSRDITERKNAEAALRESEAALRHSQRMETIGQLTGGIAHDFNNLLGIMIGNTEMLQDRIIDDAEGQDNIEDLKWAVDRAASLTNRLLAFSRKQTLSPVSVDFSDLIDDLDDLLRRTLGETINLRIKPAPNLWPATIDAHQFENTLVNLALNARDAMPGGGTLTIETANVTLGETYTEPHSDVAPGDYVRIAVSDTGAGMSPEVQEKAFEPFFTTKEAGEGTGLGLSMVYGLILQSSGHIAIYSEEGLGTTVNLYIPRSGEAAAEQDGKNETREVTMGSGRILIVEDDARVRKVPVRILQDHGYETLEAGTGKEALEHLSGGLHIDLLFTDIVLPGGMNGAEIATEAKLLQPNIKILYTTGYAENSDVVDGKLDPGVALVNKPYNREGLLEKVRATLAGDDN